MTAPKPQGKANLIHQQILGGLLANKTVTRTITQGKRDKTGKWVETQVDIPVGGLAGHVSDLSIERAAKRWAA